MHLRTCRGSIRCGYFVVLSNGMITANEGKLCVELVSVCDVTGSVEKLTFC